MIIGEHKEHFIYEINLQYKNGSSSKDILSGTGLILEIMSDPELENIEIDEGIMTQTIKIG